MGSAVRGREGRVLLGRVVLPERWTSFPFPFDPDVRWGTLFQVCFPLGRELGLVKHGHRILEGSSGSGGDKRDDGVASIGDRTGVTGALYFGMNVSRKSCSQPGSAVTSGVIRGTVAAGLGIAVVVGVGGARGMSSGRSVPGLYALVGVGALPTLDTGGVLDLDCLVLTVTGAPTNG